jgi:hypothetical protein
MQWAFSLLLQTSAMFINIFVLKQTSLFLNSLGGTDTVIGFYFEETFQTLIVM